MAAREVLALNTTVPRIEAAQSGDTYTFPRAADFPLGTAALPSIAFSGDANTGVWSPAADTVAVSTAGSERLRVTSGGNIGLGVTPSAWSTSGANGKAVELLRGSAFSLPGGPNDHVGLVANAYASSGSDPATAGWAYARAGYAASYEVGRSGCHTWRSAPSGAATGDAVTFTQRMLLDATGNLGLGVTPSGWSGGALVLPSSGYMAFNGPYANVSANAYYNSGWKFQTSAAATLYTHVAGQHQWSYTAAGTQDAAITWVTAMTLDASGNLGIGTASPSARLDIVAASPVLKIGRSSGNQPKISFGGTSSVDFFIQASSANGAMVYSAGQSAGWLGYHAFETDTVERFRVKAGGQVRFVPLASAPTDNVADGDVYYNSGTNKLQVRANGSWVDLH